MKRFVEPSQVGNVGLADFFGGPVRSLKSLGGARPNRICLETEHDALLVKSRWAIPTCRSFCFPCHGPFATATFWLLTRLMRPEPSVSLMVVRDSEAGHCADYFAYAGGVGEGAFP